MRRARTLRQTIGALLVGVSVTMTAACSDGEQGGGGDGGAQLGPLAVGTTEEFTTVDPAGSYDLPGWWILYNVGQTLLTVPPGGSQPEPDLARSCEFNDPQTDTCRLPKGRKFSDGSALTSADVKHSFDRLIAIDHPTGPSSIFATSLDSVEAPDPQTVVFHLAVADVTWPYRLTTGAATIVSESFPADELVGNSARELVFSGPYKIEQYDPSQQIHLVPNENYAGDKKLANSQVLLQPYSSESALKTAVEEGDVHVAYRSLNPTLLGDLERTGAEKGVRVVSGEGTGISYITFATSRPPFDQKEVRQAVAVLLDREVIAEEVYNGTVNPLYSIVPSAIDGSEPVFKEAYGEQPDPDRARALLAEAGVQTPVEATFWYNAQRYGEASADMYAEIKRQLEADGLFSIELDTTSWQQYQQAYAKGAYDAFQLGWFPDFPDSDNYLSPFYATDNFIGAGYGFSDPKADQLLREEKTTEGLQNRIPIFGELQRLGAEEAPVIPLWQDKMIAAVREGVTGVSKTFDAANIFRFWLISPPPQ